MTVTQATIDQISQGLVGIKYKHLGRLVEEGLDCYGLVLEFYRRLGMPLSPYIKSYYKDWYVTSDLVGQVAPLDFEELLIARPGCVATLKTGNTKVANHLIICLNSSWALNTDEVAGVHLMRMFALREKIVGYYARIGLFVTNSL